MSTNALRTLGDLQTALGEAAAIGFADNTRRPEDRRPRRPKRTGNWLAQRVCVPGTYSKRHERALKDAYLAGFDHAAHVGRGDARPLRRGPAAPSNDVE